MTDDLGGMTRLERRLYLAAVVGPYRRATQALRRIPVAVGDQNKEFQIARTASGVVLFVSVWINGAYQLAFSQSGGGGAGLVFQYSNGAGASNYADFVLGPDETLIARIVPNTAATINVVQIAF